MNFIGGMQSDGYQPVTKTIITSQHQGNKKKTTYHLVLNRTSKRRAILHLHLNDILLPPILPPRSSQQPQYPPLPTAPPWLRHPLTAPRSYLQACSRSFSEDAFYHLHASSPQIRNIQLIRA
ncbi:hypothetical protein BU17DRAFT_83617 [Hysterangium stoloniferum]|nr:hypothetical protein BU17DRAFT_83617 [Hysterangium stoloniferum]